MWYLQPHFLRFGLIQTALDFQPAQTQFRTDRHRKKRIHHLVIPKQLDAVFACKLRIRCIHPKPAAPGIHLYLADPPVVTAFFFSLATTGE